MSSTAAIRLQIETKLANRVPAALTLKIKQAPAEAASLTIQYQDVPEQAFAETLSQAGLPSEYVRYIVSLFRLTRLGVFERPTNDLEWLIGRRARTLKEYATHYREAWQ
jgi:hypothetical protein